MLSPRELLVRLALAALLLGASCAVATDYTLTTTTGANCLLHGNFGAGKADGICQGEYGPAWVAMLEQNPNTNMSVFFGTEKNSFYGTDGTLLVANVTWSDLITLRNVALLANVPPALCGEVWTGFDSSSRDCLDWTTDDSSDFGGGGLTSFVIGGAPHFFDTEIQQCCQPKGLYCVSVKSEVTGDPHFVGFDGCWFNFNGVDGNVYAILSDTDIQINALLSRMVVKGVEGTWITKLGIRTPDVSVVFDASVGLMNMEDMSLFTSTDLLRFNSTKLKLRTDEASPGHFAGLKVVTPKLHLEVMSQQFGTSSEEYYLNVDFMLFGQLVRPHGIIGQTARNINQENPDCSNPLEGAEEDYAVTDGIIGTQFAYQRYDASAISKLGLLPLQEELLAKAAW